MDGIIRIFEWLFHFWSEYISPFVLCREYEAGVILTNGKFNRYLKPGFNWKFPWPFNEVHKTLIRPETKQTSIITITTIDGVTISIGFVGRYEITDVRKWLLDANDSLSNITDDWIMFASDYATDSTFEDLKDKKTYTKIKNKVNDKIEYLGAKFTDMGYSSICKSFSVSLFNERGY